MRRIVCTALMSLLALTFVPLGSTGTAAAAAAEANVAGSAASASCSGSLEITQMAFSPASVAPGHSSTLTVTAVNCTAQPLTASLTVYGLFQQPSGTFPAGCIAIDPIVYPVNIAANGTYTLNDSFSVAATCTATDLEGVVSFGNPSGTLAQGTALLAITQPKPPVGCHVTYNVQSQWQGGFSASLAITNTGSAPVNGWTLAFTFGGDQKVANVWGASAAQNGAVVTLTNLSWDSTIASGATLSGVGMTGSWTVSNATPTGFTINGVACA